MGDVKTQKPLENPYGIGGLRSWSFSPDGKILAAGGSDGSVCLWDVETPSAGPPAQLKVLKTDIHSLAFNPDGKTLAVGTGGVSFGNRVGNLMLWEVDLWPRWESWRETPQPVNLLDILKQVKVMHHSFGSLAWSPDGKIGRFSTSGTKPLNWKRLTLRNL